MNARWKIFFAVVVFFVLMACVWLATIRIQPGNAVEAFKKSLREKGEKLEISEVLPLPVPVASNCVNAVEDAFRIIGSGNVSVPYCMKMVTPGRAMVGWVQPDARENDFTNSWEDFSIAVAADRPGIELLQEVWSRPELDFHLDYNKGFVMLLPHLAPMKRNAQKLTAAAMADLHNGDTGSAMTNICTLLALVRANQNERTIISHLVRIAMTAIASATTWEYLQATNVTDTQLARLQKDWEQMEFFHAAENSFLMERAIMTTTLERLRSSHAEFRGSVSGLSGSPSSTASSSWPLDFDELLKSAKLTAGEVMWRASWSYSEELHLLQCHQAMVEALRTMQTNQFLKPDYDAMKSRLSTLGLTNSGEAFFQALDIPDFREVFDAGFLSGTVAKTMRIEAARRVVIAAIALKRFQMKHGKLPETLNELVPEFLRAVPIDSNDGNSLRYHPNTDGTFLLYSVGENGVDDGGNPSLEPGVTGSYLHWQNNHALDWVWPQPATAAEIQTYYKEEGRKAK